MSRKSKPLSPGGVFDAPTRVQFEDASALFARAAEDTNGGQSELDEFEVTRLLSPHFSLPVNEAQTSPAAPWMIPSDSRHATPAKPALAVAKNALRSAPGARQPAPDRRGGQAPAPRPAASSSEQRQQARGSLPPRNGRASSPAPVAERARNARPSSPAPVAAERARNARPSSPAPVAERARNARASSPAPVAERARNARPSSPAPVAAERARNARASSPAPVAVEPARRFPPIDPTQVAVLQPTPVRKPEPRLAEGSRKEPAPQRPAAMPVPSRDPSQPGAERPNRLFLCSPTVVAKADGFPAPDRELAQGSIDGNLYPPISFGHYRVIEAIAQGGMGIVYRAEHVHLRREVAIKVLHDRMRHDPEAVARFVGEAMATSRIQHPNVIEVYDYGHGDDGSAYMVMELLDGESLATRLARDKSLPIDRAIDIVAQLAAALGAVHAAGIIHRDLKPENIFLARDPSGREVVKLLDFGVAKLDALGGSVPVVTRIGNLVGTPHYMAPEQGKSSREADARSDVYALGCILYEMLCGQVPFSGGMVECILAHQKTAPVPPRQLNHSLPPALDALVLAMMAKQPDQRPADMREVERRLADIDPNSSYAVVPPSQHQLAANPGTGTIGNVLASLEEPRPSRRLWPVALAIAVAGAAAAASAALSMVGG